VKASPASVQVCMLRIGHPSDDPSGTERVIASSLLAHVLGKCLSSISSNWVKAAHSVHVA